MTREIYAAFKIPYVSDLFTALFRHKQKSYSRMRREKFSSIGEGEEKLLQI